MQETARKLDWKGCLYTAGWAIVIYLVKTFLIQDIPLKIVSYAGFILLAIGFILSICEKAFDIPFFNAVPNWYGAGIIMNACSLVGIGLAFACVSWLQLLLGGLVVLCILAAQRSLMTKK